MFGLTPARRPARPTRPAIVRTAPAALEPLESRQLLSASVSLAADTGLNIIYKKETLPPSLLTTAKLKGSVSVQVTNGTAVDDVGSNTFTVYASTDDVLDPAQDVKLGTITKNVKLKAGGKPQTFTIPIKSQVAPALPATYKILTSVTDTSGTVTTTEGPTTVTVAVPFVSLSAVVGSPSPTALLPGKSVSVKVTLTNAGNINASGPIVTSIGLATTNDGSTVATNIAQQKPGKTVKANTGVAGLTYKFKIPTGTAPGTYYIAFAFTQGDDVFSAYSSTPVTIGQK